MSGRWRRHQQISSWLLGFLKSLNCLPVKKKSRTVHAENCYGVDFWNFSFAELYWNLVRYLQLDFYVRVFPRPIECFCNCPRKMKCSFCFLFLFSISSFFSRDTKCNLTFLFKSHVFTTHKFLKLHTNHITNPCCDPKNWIMTNRFLVSLTIRVWAFKILILDTFVEDFTSQNSPNVNDWNLVFKFSNIK